MSVFYQNLQLEFLPNARVYCCRKIKFHESFTTLHLVTHYQVLNNASILLLQPSY